MFKLNILIVLAFLGHPSTGQSDNYSAVLGFRDLRLSTLASAGLITEHSPNVFVFRDARPPDEAEILTGRQLVGLFGNPILLLSTIQSGGEYVHGFDAIIYSSVGEPTHNVSLKAPSTTQRRMKDWMRSQAAGARASLSNAINRLAQLGPSPTRRDEMIVRLLGINNPTRRPSILVLDLSRLSRPVAQCEQGNIREETCNGEFVRGLRPLFTDSPFDIELALFSNAQFYFSRTGAGRLTRDVNLLASPLPTESQRSYSCHEMFSRAQINH